MTSRPILISALALGFGLSFGVLGASPAHALTMKECSAKYQAAKSAGTLNGMKWNDFRKEECGSAESAASPAAAPTSSKQASSESGGSGLTMKECSTKYQAAKSAGTLNGMKWNEFRKAECSAGASAAAAAPSTTKSASGTNASEGTGLTMKECSTKYQAAKSAGTLNGMKWNEFRKAECSAGASAAAAAPAPTKASERTAEETAPSGKGLTMKECSAKYQAAKKAGTLNGTTWNEFREAICSADARSAKAPTASGNIVFPRAVSSKYSKMSAGRARLYTCVDQYRANKASNANGGLRWIEKGGGYWSECNRHLKQG